MPILDPLREFLADPWGSQAFQRMHRRAQKAESRVLKVRAMLDEVQWVSQDGEMGHLPETCPICEGYRTEGHKPDCRLDAVLRHGEEP